MRRLLTGSACDLRLDQTLERMSNPQLGWPMAYALSWISVAGGDSVMPPWVRMQFREAALIVRHLRDTGCDRPDCIWCREKNDPNRALQRWFGFEAFRSEPVDETGRPLQERIVAEAMAGRSVLGILPTGTGKSVCYQVPALSRFDKTGALTVVISPLVALMADQVQGLARAGISSAVTVNGMLSLPERHDALERVRMGDASILLISPEQLRSVSIRTVLKQREVGLWVLDEAHCISKWGHDFRPDYRYVSRFINEFSGDTPPAPMLCLTATAKPEVVSDIRDHFKSRLDADLLLLDGGAVRTNLSFEVRPTQKTTKFNDILDAIEEKLPAEAPRVRWSTAPPAARPNGWPIFSSSRGWRRSASTPGYRRTKSATSRSAFASARFASSPRPMPSAWASTSRTSASSCMATFQGRWRTTCRRRAARGATAIPPIACCSSRARMSSGNSRFPPAPAWRGTRSALS